MRKLIVHQFITLDGVIQTPGGADEDTDGGFAHGGWTHPYWHDDIGMRFSQAMENADTLLAEIRKLKNQLGKNILLDGSSVLVHTLVEHDLVDEYVLHVYPLVLGGGKKLFPDGKRVNLKLIESVSLPTGVVYQRYQTA